MTITRVTEFSCEFENDTHQNFHIIGKSDDSFVRIKQGDDSIVVSKAGMKALSDEIYMILAEMGE